MNILQVNKFYYPWIGGVETVVQDISEGLVKNDVRTEVLCCRSRGITKFFNKNNVKVTAASSFGVLFSMPISVSFFYYFYKFSKKADIIDLHHPFPLSFIAIFLFKPKSKIVVHYHSDIIRQKFFGKIFEPLLVYILKLSVKIIVSNPNMIESSKILRSFKYKCSVIHYGVDIDKIDNYLDGKVVEKIRAKYGRFVLYVGRLSYYKGLDYLILAIKNLSINLVIVGEGEEKSRLENICKNLGVIQRVHFIGHLSKRELYNYFKASAVFVLPSIYRTETYGMVLLDAMACGIPLISTDIGTGTSYINQNKITGIVIPPKNVNSLASSIMSIVNSSNNQMGALGRRRVEDFFSIDKSVNDHLKLFSSLLKNY